MEDHFTYGPRRGPCVVCGQAGTACARCRVAFYCGKEHQKLHWKLHKPTCGCLEVRADERVGRHIVAVKDIPMRTVLMRELPLVVYPSVYPSATTNPLEPTKVCVACCLKINETVPCDLCGSPLCKSSCPYLDRHNIECAALTRSSMTCFSAEKLSVIAGVRIWKSFQKEYGPRLLNLQHEIATPSSENKTVEAKKLKSACEGLWKEASSFAAKASSSVACSGPETRKGLERAYRASVINCFALKNEKYSGAALYAGLSLLEHSCLPNARIVADDDSEVGLPGLLIASRDIAAGEHVTINYAEKLLPTLSERWLSNASRGFVCRCELCEDPTEKGTYFNAWYCTTCKRADLQSLVTLVGACGWRCGVCKASGQHVDPAVQELDKSFRHRLETALGTRTDPTGEGVQRLWQRFIDGALWPKGPLHPTHYLVVKARAELLNMADPTSPPKQPAETLRQAGYLVEHCKKLVDVVVSLYPPLHSYTCSVKIFLFLFTLRKLDLQRHGLPANQRIVSSAIEKLKEELSALLAEIRCSAFEPLELTTLENLKLFV